MGEEARLIKTNLVSEKDVKTSRTEQALQEVLEKSILPLFELLFERLQVFDELFLKKDIQFGGDSQTMAISNWIEARSVFNKLMSENQFKFRIKLSYHLDGFNKAGFNTFFISFNLIWTLEDFKYIFRFENIESTKDKDFSIPKLYDQFYSQDELLEITNRCGNVLYQQIEKRLNPPPPNDITHLL